MAWQLRVGDPAEFAIEWAFTPNPDGETDASTREESASWGSFILWVAGENLCAHHELGEIVEASHWYLLPVMEWLVDNWNAIFHEERLPFSSSFGDAASALEQRQTPPLRLKEVDEFEWLGIWSAWWHRHNLRASRDGGLLPDVYLRRYRGQFEISTGTADLAGVPTPHAFVNRGRVYRLDPLRASELIYESLTAALSELMRRVPSSSRLARLENRLVDLVDRERNRDTRIAFVSGLDPESEDYRQLVGAIDDVFTETPDLLSPDLSTNAGHLVTMPSPVVRLLYGALSPSVTHDDVLKIGHALLQDLKVTRELDELVNVGDELIAGQGPMYGSPGEQGSALGESAAARLAATSDTYVDVHGVLRLLGVHLDSLELSDSRLRAVSAVGPAQAPRIYWNQRFEWGHDAHVVRFSLAHELSHLLFDREFGDQLAVASGPWAPGDIEQRANAFAAAFLMPTWLIRDRMTTHNADLAEIEDLARLSADLRVGTGALVDRLYNLGEIPYEVRWSMQKTIGGRRRGRPKR